jgi:hypothetical protein
MSFTNKEQIENIDKMVRQYFSVIFDLIKKISDMLEKRKELNKENEN